MQSFYIDRQIRFRINSEIFEEKIYIFTVMIEIRIQFIYIILGGGKCVSYAYSSKLFAESHPRL